MITTTMKIQRINSTILGTSREGLDLSVRVNDETKEINWPAYGDVSVKNTEDFIKLLQDAVKELNN